MVKKNLVVDLGIKDVVTHMKDDARSIPLFGEVRDGDERLMTVNVNFNNVTPEGFNMLKEKFGENIAINKPLKMTLIAHPTLDTYTKPGEEETEEEEFVDEAEKEDQTKLEGGE